MKELLTSPATLRVLLYILAPIVAMLPGVTLDQITHTITIDIDAALIGASAGGVFAGGIFAAFGKK